jgi:hypothetical protein
MFHALYDAASTITEMVGLTPVDVVVLVGVLASALILWNLARNIFGRSTWTLDPAVTSSSRTILTAEQVEAASQRAAVRRLNGGGPLP